MPPPSPRRRSPKAYHRYGAEERCKDPITHSRRTGNRTRVTVSSAQDAYQSTGVAYVPAIRPRAHPHGTRHRQDYGNHDYRRSRSRSIVRDHARSRTSSSSGTNYGYGVPETRRFERRRSRSHGSIDADDVSALDFDFEMPDSIASASKPELSTETLETTVNSQHKPGSVPVAGATTNLHLAESKWLGNTFDKWDVGVKLMPVAPHLRPAMSWHHLERTMPTFDEFIAVARRELQHVPERNLRRVEEMLRKIQRENEKQRQHGREMVPVCVSDAEYQNDPTKSTQKFSACFSSFPFFSLEKLAQSRLGSSTTNAPFHPARPLLQTYTRTVNDKRELAQVIAKRSSTPQGHSLHSSSVWCLIVNEDTIITCSKISLGELHKDFASINNQQSPASARIVRVKSGNTRSWSFPADDLRSWPSLLAMFADDLSAIGDRDARATFMHHGRVVNAQMWTQILARASNLPIELALQDGKDDNDSGLRSKLQIVKEAFKPRATAHVQQPDIAMNNVGTRPDIEESKLATTDEVINHLRSIPALNIFQRDSGMINKPLSHLADALHDTLATHSQKSVLQGYDLSSEATIKDVQVAISQDMPISGRAGDRREHIGASGKFGQIALLAEYMFTFFWPVDCDHIMTRRFWGAVRALLRNQSSHDVHTNDARRDAEMAYRNAEMATEFYDVLYHRVFAVASALTTSLAGSEVTTLASFPNQFYEAWLHMLSAFVLLSQEKVQDNGRHAWRLQLEQLRAAARKLEAGEAELVVRLRKIEVEEHEVCSTRGIVALMFNNLSRDTIRDAPDVAQTYGDYYQQLAAKVLGNPLTRAHQASIRDLQQELEAVLSILTHQLDVVNVFERSIQAQDEDQRMPYLPPLLDSRQDAVLETCKNTLAARIDQFKALRGRVTELGEWHLGEIDNNKDKQEAAIMVFTIVTIIFLPLSFVSSVLGMNTSDIRDMQYGQWIYWVVAIPLTIVVIAGSLYWAGALGDWQAWPSRNDSSKGYRPMAAEDPVRMAVPRRGPVEEQYVEKIRRRTTFPARDAGRHYV